MTYSLKVKFSPETVEKLNKNKFTLCCFLAFKTENKNQVSSLCWYTVQSFLELLKITWEYRLNVYVSLSEIKENEVICVPQDGLNISKSKLYSNAELPSPNTCSYRNIALKQRLLIKDYGGLSVDTFNDNETVLIENKSTTLYTSGTSIYSVDNEQFFGNCAFRTYGMHTVEVTPTKKIFLMFSSKPIESNTVVLNTENQGILVEMPTSEERLRTIYYDINSGWSSKHKTWSKNYDAGTDLNSILIS